MIEKLTLFDSLNNNFYFKIITFINQYYIIVSFYF